ncbi:B3 domain-containing transcription factor FUS3 [Punica granatum]|uniref:B3 domain-containing transcription factor FUS3 n=1 Tax=Punica granatum TaxID=22663 RepID=A0A218WDV4_PUNGR|nr:B3 domain-containing transcription factor FUS3 [Punica granatum]OWM70713.1 hypothetical protein CDL15_Pgr014386 [Punica granatum]
MTDGRIIIVPQSAAQKNELGGAVALERDRVAASATARKLPGGGTRPEPGRDLVAAAGAGVGVHRKKRNMARQRRPAIKFLSFANSCNSSSSSSSHVPPEPSPAPARGLDPRRLRFLFEKELKNSDVGSLRRMILPKKAAEAHLPVLESKEGIPISMHDIDGLHVWSFKYRFWPNNNSRMYVLENTGDFVNTHGLQLGDFIMVYQDDENQNYVIQARKASDEEDVYRDIAKSTINDLCLQDNYDQENKVSSFNYEYYPIIDDVGMSFIYDTTFSSDSPLDFLGGSMTNFTRIGPPESFGSVENLSLDDFY